MQQQNIMQMQPMMPAYHNVTTEHIQWFLDENKVLIIKILESQNSGNMSERTEYYAKLEQNLRYLAAIADAHPPVLQPNMQPQVQIPSAISLQGSHYMQQAQPQMTPQSLMAAGSPMLYSQQQLSSMQQQQARQVASGSTGLYMMPNAYNPSYGYPDYNSGMTSGTKQEIGSSSGAQAHQYLRDRTDGKEN